MPLDLAISLLLLTSCQRAFQENETNMVNFSTPIQKLRLGEYHYAAAWESLEQEGISDCS